MNNINDPSFLGKEYQPATLPIVLWKGIIRGILVGTCYHDNGWVRLATLITVNRYRHLYREVHRGLENVVPENSNRHLLSYIPNRRPS